MRLPDADQVRRIIEAVAAEAVLPRFQALEAGQISEKAGPHDVVTIADTEAERLLVPQLAALVPGSKVVGEEAASAAPELMEALRGGGAVWLIDPIDGTANFAVGLHLFAMMVSFVVDGDARMAWICDPVRGVAAMAESGAGAMLHGGPRGSQRLQVARPPSLSHLAGAPNIRYGDRKLAARIGERCDRISNIITLRCAGQEYLAIAEGKIHFALYNRALPWDHAAGCLLVSEAGGVARRLDGSLYRAADKPWISPLLVACGPDQWQWLNDGLLAP